MSKPYVGYESADEYVRAINEELTDSARMGQGASVRRQQRGAGPGPDRANRMIFRDPDNPKRPLGKAGSKERWQYVKQAAEEVLPGMGREAAKLEAVQNLYGALSENVIDAREVARHVLVADDPEVYGAVREHLDGTPELNMVDHLVVNAVQGEIERKEEAHRSRLAEQAEQRQQVLTHELSSMHPYDRENVLESVPVNELDPTEAVLQMRAVEAMSASQRAALRRFQIHSDLTEELKRIGGPGSSWNDDERARWEAEMDAGVIQNFDRDVLSADRAAEIAVESLQPKPAMPPYAEAIIAELDEHNAHSAPEHLSEARSRARRPEDYIPTGEPGSSASPQLPERMSYAE